MANKRLALLFLIFWSVGNLLAQDIAPLASGELIEHTYCSLSYSEQHEQAEWVFHELKSANIDQGYFTDE